MADYAFSFATVAAYQSAKQSSGTAEIYNALIPSSTTGSTTNVSRSCVSFIAELGRSVVDSVNLCVPYAEGGFVGDVLCYSSTYGYFWMKDPCASWDYTALGQTYYDSTTWPSGFKRIGYCFKRVGKRGLITELSNGSGLAWDSRGGSAPAIDVFTSTSIPYGRRINTWIAGCMEAAEAVWGSSYYVYSWPFPRASWDAMVSAIKTGTATAQTSIGDSWWKVEKNSTTGAYIGTAHVVGTTTFDVDPADYGYDFDRFYRANIEAINPGPSGTVMYLGKDGSGRLHDGLRNTRIMYETLGEYSPAAARAMAFGSDFSTTPKHGVGYWWIPTLPELVDMMKVYPRLNRNGAGFSTSYAYWSSDQYNAASAWRVYLSGGYVDRDRKNYGNQVRLVSAFEVL